jgi:hypothetical protein
MATIAVNVRRKGQSLDLDADLHRARWLATLLDAEFSFAGMKFGLDPIIGLLPVVGDTICFAAGLYPLYLARKYKLGKAVEFRMAANLLIDYFGGLIPVVGDAFDVAFKANLMNVDLLEKVARNRCQRPD